MAKIWFIADSCGVQLSDPFKSHMQALNALAAMPFADRLEFGLVVECDESPSELEF